MKNVIFGAGGFLGVNLALELINRGEKDLLLADIKKEYFPEIIRSSFATVKEFDFFRAETKDFISLVSGADVVYHLACTVIPATSDKNPEEEFSFNVLSSIRLFEACAAAGVKKVVFFSSGGTVYGNAKATPIKEDSPLAPISFYGAQKVAVENLLKYYNLAKGLDYRVVRISNPYGPYQRPYSGLGAVTTFIDSVRTDREIILYGEGRTKRDFIFVTDAVKAVVNVAEKSQKYKVYNIGSGKATSIKEVLSCVCDTLGKIPRIKNLPERDCDVKCNNLDVSRYEEEFGEITSVGLEEGIKITAEFLKNSEKV